MAGLPAWARKHSSSRAEGSSAEVEADGGHPVPPKITVDLDTPLEQFFSGLAFCSGIAIFFLLQAGILGGKRTPPNPALLKYLFPALAVGALALILRKTTNNYYVVESSTRTVFYHFETLFWKSFRAHFKPSEIYAIGVTAEFKSSKKADWHEYQVVLIDTRGKMHPLSDFVREDRGDKNTQARLLARALGCRFLEGKEGHRLCADLSGREVTIDYQPRYTNIDAEGCTTVLFVICLIIGAIILVSVLI